MELDELQNLLERPESESLDWKRDFPHGLSNRDDVRLRNEAKGNLLKDLVALANVDESASAHLVYGIKDERVQRRVLGISTSWDDAVFQSWNRNAFDPPLVFDYSELFYDRLRVGIFRIKRVPEYPHVAIQTIGELHEGQVWFRVATQNIVANRSQLERMFLGHDPFKIAGLNDPAALALLEHYSQLGREVVYVSFAEKDSRLFQGYQLARFPGTRREVHLGEGIHGTPELIALLRPL